MDATREVSMGLVHFYVVMDATLAQGRDLDPVMFAVCDLYTCNNATSRVLRSQEGAPHRTGLWESTSERRPSFRSYPVKVECIDEKVCYWDVPSEMSEEDVKWNGLSDTDLGCIAWSEYHTMTLHY